MKSIVIVSGPPGSGKSTVSQELVKTASLPTVYIEGDTFWPFITKSIVSEDEHKNFKATMAAIMAAAIPYANAGYQVILDFSFPPGFIETAKTMASKRDIPLYFFVLRPDLETCMTRAATRAEGKITNYEPLKGLYASYDKSIEYIVHDDGKTPENIALSIRDGLKTEKHRVI